MQKTIQVIKCEIKKQGRNEKTGKDWTLYTVACNGDDEMKDFSTFNQDYMNAEGQQMRGEFEYNEKFKNWQEISASQAKTNEKHDEIMNAIRKVWDRIDEVGKQLDK